VGELRNHVTRSSGSRAFRTSVEARSEVKKTALVYIFNSFREDSFSWFKSWNWGGEGYTDSLWLKNLTSYKYHSHSCTRRKLQLCVKNRIPTRNILKTPIKQKNIHQSRTNSLRKSLPDHQPTRAHTKQNSTWYKTTCTNRSITYAYICVEAISAYTKSVYTYLYLTSYRTAWAYLWNKLLFQN
jgi:hypothetical protein